MPRQIIPALLIKEQAGIDPKSHIIRDLQSPNDSVIENDENVDLGAGNVFRSAQHAPPSQAGCDPNAPAKLAFILNDAFVFAVEPTQTEGALRRQFGLNPKVQLLRDLVGPNDKPIADDEKVHFKDGPVFVTVFDIEEHCKDGDALSPCDGYLIRVDDTKIVMRESHPTGREILLRAGKDPKLTMLNQKIGKRFEPVPLDKKVDLTACGVERFTTLPNEQSEGRGSASRDFALPELDQELLEDSNLNWETVQEGESKWLIIHDIAVPQKFLQRPTSVAIQILPGYPSTPLDMAYFNPPVHRIDNKTIPCTEAVQIVRGLGWQRWSRHYTPENPWKLGEYNTLTHYLLSQSWLDREAQKP